MLNVFTTSRQIRHSVESLLAGLRDLESYPPRSPRKGSLEDLLYPIEPSSPVKKPPKTPEEARQTSLQPKNIKDALENLDDDEG
jgi:hypothetical protein